MALVSSNFVLIALGILGFREDDTLAEYIYAEKEPVSRHNIAVATSNSSLSSLSLIFLGAKSSQR